MIGTIFFLVLGALIAANSILSIWSRDSALKLTAFLLAFDLGASIGLQLFIQPPDRQVWLCIVDSAIIFIWLYNRHLYAGKPVLRAGVPLGYLLMMLLSITFIVTHGQSVRLSEIVSDAIYILLLSVNLWGGIRNAFAKLGTGSGHSDWAVRPDHIRAGDRR